MTDLGYRAKKNSHVIDLSRLGHYAATDFWEPLQRHRNDSLLLEPEEFYILGSKERIRVPPDYAAEMVAYEAACGELRTHYAGFFDPGFGYGAGETAGHPGRAGGPAPRCPVLDPRRPDLFQGRLRADADGATRQGLWRRGWVRPTSSRA